MLEAMEKALRELIEDAARILDKQAAGFQVLIDHAPTPIRAEDLKRVKHCLESSAQLIRALGEPERKERELSHDRCPND